jgi:hypothetical protein
MAVGNQGGFERVRPLLRPARLEAGVIDEMHHAHPAGERPDRRRKVRHLTSRPRAAAATRA